MHCKLNIVQLLPKSRQLILPIICTSILLGIKQVQNMYIFFQLIFHLLSFRLTVAQRFQITNSAKNYIRKVVKLTVHAYACNNLTSFKYAVHGITRNGNDVNLLKQSRKIREMTLGELIFGRFFVI